MRQCLQLLNSRAIGIIVLICTVAGLGAPVSRAQSQDARSSLMPIYRIQGDRAMTSYVDWWVNTMGVVTGVTATGFYLQDPIGDDNPATSDGIFVYTYSAPHVVPGQCVLVERALVSEFYEKTELSRSKSATAVDDCPRTTVYPVTLPLPRYGISPTEVYERFEGMLVQVDNVAGTVQGPTKHLRNGQAELAILPAGLEKYLAGGRLFQVQEAPNWALIHLSNALGASLPEAGWGDTVAIGQVTANEEPAVNAVVDFNFGKYQLLPLPDQPYTHQPRPAPEEQGLMAAADEFTVCSVNLYALGRGSEQIRYEVDYRAHLRQRALLISERLHGCTIIGIQEAGTPDDVVQLSAELSATFGLDYEATALPGPQTDNPEFPLTNGLLTRRDRVRFLAASAPQSCTAIDYEVASQPAACPAGEFALFDRTPLVVDLTVTGAWVETIPLRVIVNHLKSKAGDEAVNALRRSEQARAVAEIVQATIDANPAASVIVMGDLNDYYQSATLETLRTGTTPALIHTLDFLPELERYTYIFNGASQVLDHILITPNLLSALANVDVVHINVDFPYPTQVDFTNVHHASDHDPIQIRLRPAGAAILGGNLRYPGIRVDLVDSSNQALGTTFTDALGEFRFWSLAPESVSLRFTAAKSVYLPASEMTLSLHSGYNPIETPPVGHQAANVGHAAVYIGLALAQ